MQDIALLTIKGFFILFMCIGSVIDIRKRKIPCEIPFAIFGLGISRIGIDDNLTILSAVAGAVIPLVLFAIVELTSKENVIGGGDYKLFMAVGFFLGCPDIITMMLITFLAAAIFSAIKREKVLPLCPFALIGSLFAIL